MVKLWTTFSFFLLLALTACDTGATAQKETKVNTGYGSGNRTDIEEDEKPKVQDFEFKAFDRKSNVERIARKIKNEQPLVVHMLVPLCDNKNQGIIPVSEKLGNGLKPETNLYWGALYGIKNHFKQANDWQSIKNFEGVNDQVLERAVYLKKFPNGAKVYLVADAYRGDKMAPCLQDFFATLSGSKIDELSIEKDGQSHEIPLYSEADFIAFNGHNGLMDFEMEYFPNEDGVKKDVAVIGCSSFEFFKNHLNIAKAYPLLTTNGLMAPEAYTAEAIINQWAENKTDSDFRLAAATAYHKYQKCGMKGAMGLFKSGW